MEIRKKEKLTQTQVNGLKTALGFQLWAIGADFSKVDLDAGQGIGKGNDRCLWFTDGRRLDVHMSHDGGIVASVTKDIDPNYKPTPTVEENEG